MALTLKSLGLDKGPKKQRWYLDSPERPWKDLTPPKEEKGNKKSLQPTEKSQDSKNKRGTEKKKGEQNVSEMGNKKSAQATDIIEENLNKRGTTQKIKGEQSNLKGEQAANKAEMGNKIAQNHQNLPQVNLINGEQNERNGEQNLILSEARISVLESINSAILDAPKISLNGEQDRLNEEQNQKNGEQNVSEMGNKKYLQHPNIIEEKFIKRGTTQEIKGEQNERNGEQNLEKGNKNRSKWGTEKLRNGEQLPKSKQQIFILQSLAQIQSREGGKYTSRLTKLEIAAITQIALESLKVQLKRLLSAGLLERIDFQIGRGSDGAVYKIPATVLEKLSQLKGEQNKFEKGNKVEIKRGTSGLSSSSSNYLIHTTTTSERVDEKIFDEWKQINFESLLEIGFSESHVEQIRRRQKLSSEQLQQSIFAFAFDLKNNNKAASLKKRPLDFFMGIIGNGMPYAPPMNYLSPEEEAIKAYNERQKEIKERREKMLKETKELAFDEWRSKRSETELRALIPEVSARERIDGFAVTGALYNVFEKTVWEQMRNRLLQAS